MSITKNKQKTHRAEMREFLGIDRSSLFGTHGCESIKNFRIDPSGALIKRSGRKKLADIPEDILSAVYFPTEKDDGTAQFLVLAPPKLYAATDSGKLYTVADDVGSAGMPASLCIFGGAAYVADGRALRVYDPETDSLVGVSPYAPLYGRAWDPERRGAVYESPNLLTNNIRINYKTSAACDSLYIGFETSGIARVDINGSPTTQFTLEGYKLKGSFPENSEIDVWLTRKDPNGFNCRQLAAFLCGGDERLVAYSSGSDGAVAYLSSTPKKADIAASKSGFFGSGSLYFPADLSFSAGGAEITSVAPCLDGFCVFTKRSTSLVFPKNDGIEAYTLSREIGALAPRASFCRGREVYTVADGGIYRFDIDPSTPQKTEFEKISAVIEGDELLISELDCAILDSETDSELWFSLGGTVYVLNLKFRCFYSYPAMSAVALCKTENGLCLFESDSIWIFSDELFSDLCGDTAEPIYASIRSHWIDFDDVTRKKRNLSVYPTFEMSRGEYFMLGVQTDSGSFLPVTVDGKGRSVPETAKLRAHGCRFRRAAVSLTCYGEGRPRILCLALTADSAE